MGGSAQQSLAMLEQPYVDPQRVELVGVSLGAFFVSVPGALDPADGVGGHSRRYRRCASARG